MKVLDLSVLSREDREELAAALLEKEKRGASGSKVYQKKYYNDPLAWVKDFCSIRLSSYHESILEMIHEGNKKIAVFGPHGLGKSVLAALLILWAGSVSPDCKVLTTASAWRQLEKFLWPEVHKWYGRVDWNRVKAAGGPQPRLLTLECQFSPQSSAFAVASDNPVNIEGAHADRIVYIFDESKAIMSGTWESADGAFSTPGDHLQIALSTPGDTSGVFYSICSRARGYEAWKVRHVSLREAIRDNRITLAWAREKREQWGAGSAAYQTRVWGKFATDSPDIVIPFSWVEAAIQRWYAWRDTQHAFRDGTLIVGADTAGQGADKTSFCLRHKNVLAEIQRFAKSEPMELAGRLKILMGAKGFLNIDTSFGEGAGTAGRIKEFQGYSRRVNCVNFAAKSERMDKSGLLEFANTRAALWWGMREQLDPTSGYDICLPDDPMLIGDLTAPRRKMRSDGKILIESKEDIKARIGRSTDDGDACCLAFWSDKYIETENNLSPPPVSAWFGA